MSDWNNRSYYPQNQGYPAARDRTPQPAVASSSRNTATNTNIQPLMAPIASRSFPPNPQVPQPLLPPQHFAHYNTPYSSPSPMVSAQHPDPPQTYTQQLVYPDRPPMTPMDTTPSRTVVDMPSNLPRVDQVSVVRDRISTGVAPDMVAGMAMLIRQMESVRQNSGLSFTLTTSFGGALTRTVTYANGEWSGHDLTHELTDIRSSAVFGTPNPPLHQNSPLQMFPRLQEIPPDASAITRTIVNPQVPQLQPPSIPTQSQQVRITSFRPVTPPAQQTAPPPQPQTVPPVYYCANTSNQANLQQGVPISIVYPPTTPAATSHPVPKPARSAITDMVERRKQQNEQLEREKAEKEQKERQEREREEEMLKQLEEQEREKKKREQEKSKNTAAVPQRDQRDQDQLIPSSSKSETPATKPKARIRFADDKEKEATPNPQAPQGRPDLPQAPVGPPRETPRFKASPEELGLERSKRGGEDEIPKYMTQRSAPRTARAIKANVEEKDPRFYNTLPPQNQPQHENSVLKKDDLLQVYQATETTVPARRRYQAALKHPDHTVTNPMDDLVPGKKHVSVLKKPEEEAPSSLRWYEMVLNRLKSMYDNYTRSLNVELTNQHQERFNMLVRDLYYDPLYPRNLSCNRHYHRDRLGKTRTVLVVDSTLKPAALHDWILMDVAIVHMPLSTLQQMSQLMEVTFTNRSNITDPSERMKPPATIIFENLFDHLACKSRLNRIQELDAPEKLHYKANLAHWIFGWNPQKATFSW